MIDEWTELEAPPKAAKVSEPVTFGAVVLRHGAAKATFSIAESVMAELGRGPRYRVAWNRDRKQFRIRAAADGTFETFNPPRGPKAPSSEAVGGEGGGGGRRFILRCPLPDGLVAAKGKGGVAHTLDKVAKTLTVTVPSRFWRERP